MSEKVGIFSFLAFTLASLMVASERKRMTNKPLADWITDLASVAMHFFVLPALQIVLVYKLLGTFLPQYKGAVQDSWWLSALLYLLIDYGWYWNHRIFHAQTPLWNLHKTHHSPEQVDVFVTPRNALVAHFLMVYFWFIAAIVYVLRDPTFFLWLTALGTVVNFWGHTNFYLPCDSLLNRVVRVFLVTPREHLWHHSRENPHCNFATVFSFWDRWHGTDYCGAERPTGFGEPSKRTVWNQLIWPF